MPVKRYRRRRNYRRRKKRRPATASASDYHQFRMVLATKVITSKEASLAGAVSAYFNTHSLSQCYWADSDGVVADVQGLNETPQLKPMFDTYRVRKIKISYIPDFNMGIIDNSGNLPGIYITSDPDSVGQISTDPNDFIVRSNTKFRDLKRAWSYTCYPKKVIQGQGALTGGWLNLQAEASNTEGVLGLLSSAGVLSTSGQPILGKILGSLKVEYFVEFKNRKTAPNV